MSEISELFLKDSLKLTKDDRRKIIEKYREDRKRFLLGQKVPKNLDRPKINLDDLDL